MPTTYFLTGGAGNLACQLSFLLAPRGRVVLFDVAEAPVAAIAPGCEYVRGDMSRREDVERALEQYQPTTVLHFASLLSASCEANRERAWQINMDGTFALLEAALRGGVERVFFPSSLAAYGGKLPDPLPEDFSQWPQSLYGVSKMAGERLGAYYHEKHGLDFRCLRLPLVISRFAPSGAASAYASRAFIEAAQTGSFCFRVNPDTRVSTMYVRDVLSAITDFLAAPPENLTRRVYNIHAISPSAADIAAAIKKRRAAQFTFEPDADIVSLIESWPARIEDETARRDWGWQPHFDLERLADDFLKEIEEETP